MYKLEVSAREILEMGEGKWKKNLKKTPLQCIHTHNTQPTIYSGLGLNEDKKNIDLRMRKLRHKQHRTHQHDMKFSILPYESRCWTVEPVSQPASQPILHTCICMSDSIKKCLKFFNSLEIEISRIKNLFSSITFNLLMTERNRHAHAHRWTDRYTRRGTAIKELEDT